MSEHNQLSSAYNQHHCDVHDSVTLRCVTRCVTSGAGAGGANSNVSVSGFRKTERQWRW